MADDDVTAPRDIRAGGCRVLAPGDPDWDGARSVFNLLIDERPAAIALPQDEADVIDAVAVARERGLRVTAQGTGHGAGSLLPLDGIMLVNTSRLTEVGIDADARRVRVGAGVRWRDVAPRLAELGLAALHGSSPDVGIAGYSLGGGIGWLSRRHGLQCNAVRAVELVTADGRMLRVDADHEPELFWALRGGGGSFGIVTAIEFDVVPVAELAAGALFFPAERTAEVLRAWTDLLPSLPDELTTWVAVIHFPPFDEVPAEVRGRSFAIVMAAFLGPESAARDLLAPVIDLGPELDAFATQSPSALGTLAMDPEQPLPYRTVSAVLDRLPPETIDEVARIAADASALTLVQFRHAGGALSRVDAEAGSLAALPGDVVMFGLGLVAGPGAEATVRARLAELASAVAPAFAGDYANLVEEPADASAFFDAATWDRLERVKADWDPDDVVVGTHHVPARARA
jgi:FAD/FMN-containing dehydrogenase